MLKFSGSILIAVPLLISTLVSLLMFDYPDGFFAIPIFFLCIGGLIIIMDLILSRTGRPKSFKISDIEMSPELELFVRWLGIFLIGMCCLDLAVHGVVLGSDIPGHYMTFTGLEKRIRHVSSLIWILGPLAFLIKSNRIKALFFLSAFGFPVLFLDRGRVLLALIAVLFSVVLAKKVYSAKASKIAVSCFMLLMGILVFGFLGGLRSGAGDSKLAASLHGEPYRGTMNCPLEEGMPARPFFKDLDVRMQWFFVYAGSPIFNLATQDFCGFRDSTLIKAQLIPRWREHNQIGYYPVVSQDLNVATEFLPFYAWLGWPGLVAAILLAYLMLRLSVYLLVEKRDVFLMLIFFRLGYCMIFLNFAPQLFIWTTFAFVILMVFLKWLSKKEQFNTLLSHLDESVSTLTRWTSQNEKGLSGQ